MNGYRMDAQWIYDLTDLSKMFCGDITHGNCTSNYFAKFAWNQRKQDRFDVFLYQFVSGVVPPCFFQDLTGRTGEICPALFFKQRVNIGVSIVPNENHSVQYLKLCKQFVESYFKTIPLLPFWDFFLMNTDVQHSGGQGDCLFQRGNEMKVR